MTEDFIRDGFIVIENALDPAFCDEVARQAMDRLNAGPSGARPGTTHLAVAQNWDLDEVAPTAASVLDELVGGRDNIKFSGVQDNLIVNLANPDAMWWAPSEFATNLSGWHKDGDWFRHFLDSPEQGVLGIVFWDDVSERQGPTYVAADSVKPIAALLAAHPEGIDPPDLPIRRLVAQCSDFRALTGSKGSVAWVHPFMVHTASVNDTQRPRLISNTSVMLRRPMRFDREDRSFTPVEQSILDSLGVGHLDFSPTAERSRFVSQRERDWANTKPRMTDP